MSFPPMRFDDTIPCLWCPTPLRAVDLHCTVVMSFPPMRFDDTIPCLWCPTPLRAVDLVEHLEKFHVGSYKERWGCGSCDYVNDSFDDAVGHCILEKHNPQELKNVNPVTEEHFIELAKQWRASKGDAPTNVPNTASSDPMSGPPKAKRPRAPF